MIDVSRPERSRVPATAGGAPGWELGAATSTARSRPGWSDAGRSADLFARAEKLVPGGVNSPVRAFRAVGGTPRFMVPGRGPWLTDADGNRYVDLVCSWGPMILGHAHPAVVEAVREAAGAGCRSARRPPVRSSSPRRSSAASGPCSRCAW